MLFLTICFRLAVKRPRFIGLKVTFRPKETNLNLQLHLEVVDILMINCQHHFIYWF